MTTRTAKRTAKPLDPPSLDDDPAERKRQLNVLAQRRYRRRKREQIQKLERLAAGQGADETGQTTTSPSLESASDIVPTDIATNDYVNQSFPEIQVSSLDWLDQNDNSNLDCNVTEICCFDTSTFGSYDTTLDFPLPPISSSSTSSSSTSPASSISPRSVQSDQLFLSRDELAMPQLQMALFRGLMTIAKRLEIDQFVFDIHAVSPFCLPNTALNSYQHLPPSLRPTAVQRSTPHHPALDLLPWPDVRDKLIMVFSQPVEIRPPSARSPTAFVEWIYDLEDSAEGARIWGEDPADEGNWEVGEKVYDRWWWALSAQVVTQANAWRGARGARLLGSSTRQATHS